MENERTASGKWKKAPKIHGFGDVADCSVSSYQSYPRRAKLRGWRLGRRLNRPPAVRCVICTYPCAGKQEQDRTALCTVHGREIRYARAPSLVLKPLADSLGLHGFSSSAPRVLHGSTNSEPYISLQWPFGRLSRWACLAPTSIDPVQDFIWAGDLIWSSRADLERASG